MQQRKDEILAKKAKLAELKRQREQRAKEFTASRQSIGDGSELVAPIPSRANNRADLDNLISSLVGDSRPSSAGPREPSSPAQRGSRPTSVVSAGQLSGDQSEIPSPGHEKSAPAPSLQTLSIAPLTTVYDFPASPKAEIITYSKGVQTSDVYEPQRARAKGFSDSEDDGAVSPSKSPRKKRLSRREKEREEELRQNLRREIEEELKAIQNHDVSAAETNGRANFPSRLLTNEELNAVTSSIDFQGFVDRSTKVIERALEQEYDILADYAVDGLGAVDDDELGASTGRRGRRVKEVAQFWDERWSKKRMISDLNFSPKFPELVLASYTKNPSAPHDPDGLIQVWNLHMHERPEYVFHAQSDILTARFSPFHPNFIIGGCYSGQVLLWDTRAKSAPVQKTPLTGSGHTHPIYSIDIVGTQNANNIISCSTDGVVCGWSVDMLSQPQEYLELQTPQPAKSEEMAPTCIAFPQSDPTYFLAGTEEGSIHPCHRYDRAGAKAGVDTRISYRGHAAPVMSLDFHPARGKIDLGDLVLSSSLDWSVKLWKARPPAAAAGSAAAGSAGAGGGPGGAGGGDGGGGVGAHVAAQPLMEIGREDLVYDARWSPVKPGVFALVDGAGALEIWDLTVEVEVPVAKTKPSARGTLGGGASSSNSSYMAQSLNKCSWEPHEGKRIAVGGLEGVVSVFEVGAELGGVEGTKQEEWAEVKKMVTRLDQVMGNGGGEHGR
ncbi:cytoplasmic dynein intermediate chain [Viridothelium virens]|uniref:Cytoplasmic dynein intermediate chain n=1 Tax=Viridothelium virens TaxID=1048519 RepID=A0A6A6GVF4_VIRVR|nr:cytoplasmic dynein intermediate chain [Viridothelium virens]